MQVTETLNEGLRREIKVVIPAEQMEERMMERVEGARGKMRIKGFRPGKVPTSHIRRLYGKSFMAEIVNEIISNSPNEMLSERGEKPAVQPEIAMTEDQDLANRVLEGEADFEFTMNYEVIPDFDLKDAPSGEVTRPVVEISDEEVEEQVRRIAESSRSFETKDGKAEDGDRVTIDYVGKLDGEPFEGGTDQGANLTLGSNTFIPGFEEQLVGVKAGDSKTIDVTFPEQYGAQHLAGKEAQFDIEVKEVASAKELTLDDELAKSLGLESMDKLREIVRDQIQGQYGQMTRQKVKRQILDQLDEQYQFETPQKLVDAEFDSIWQQVTGELERAGRSFDDEETTEEEARTEYRKLAERRVRLGLVLSRIGEKAEVAVSDEELQRALYEQVRRYPGQEQQVYEFYRSNPNAIASLRAPLFEEKVIDNLIEQMNVKDETVSKEELMAEDEGDELLGGGGHAHHGHSHDHDHDHDHHHDHDHDHDH